MRFELQGSAVLCHRPHDLVASSLWQVGCDLKPDCDVGADLADKVRNHFFRNPAGVAADTSRVQGDTCGCPARRHADRVALARAFDVARIRCWNASGTSNR